MSELGLSPRRLLSLLSEVEGGDDQTKMLRELRRYVEDRLEPPETVAATAESTSALKSAYDTFMQKTRFQPGDLVKWKPKCKNRKKPAYDQPVIVVSHLEDPIFSEQDEPASPYYREPLDLILGFLGEDDEFLCYYFDSRRFLPYVEPSCPSGKHA